MVPKHLPLITPSLPVHQWTSEESEEFKEDAITRGKEVGSLHDCMDPGS